MTRPIISSDLPGERTANVSASGRQHDYYSILVEAIKKTEQNSAQLRQLVYERARFNFKRDLLFGHSSLGLSDLVQHINDFELAVARIEATAMDNRPHPQYREHEREHAPNHPETSSEDDRPHISYIGFRKVRPGSRSTLAEHRIQILPSRPARPLYTGLSAIHGWMPSLTTARRKNLRRTNVLLTN